MRPRLRRLLATMYIGAGAKHLARPRGSVRIVPEYLPEPAMPVATSRVVR